MTNFISLEGAEYGVKEFTHGSGGKFVSYEEMYANTTMPMCWSGFFKPSSWKVVTTAIFIYNTPIREKFRVD